MKVIQALPPNFEQIKAAIKIDDWDKWIKEKGTVFTYGDTIYNPSDAKFPVHLLVHEGTHEKQQGSNPKEWWDKYLVDLEFRFEQELEAYSAQYKFICECNGPSFPAKVKKAILNSITSDLCSDQYGLKKEYAKVESLIRNKAKL